MELTANDLLPLVLKLSRDERERLAQLAVAPDPAEPTEVSPAGEASAGTPGDIPDYENMSFGELLLSMPNVGEDSDFARPRDMGRDIDL